MAKAVGVAKRLTSPLALMRVVWNRSPLPQEFWVFHTRSVGGLWEPPPLAAQICSPTEEERRTVSNDSVMGPTRSPVTGDVEIRLNS